MMSKNKDRGMFYTKIRRPYKGVFLKTNHRARYKGIAKKQFTAFIKDIDYNLKRILDLDKVY
jgi:hypothetical protein